MIAVLPVKPLADAKQRLAPVLDAADRHELAGRLFRQTLALLLEWPGTGRTVVISPDAEVCADAERAGARAVREPCAAGINAALARAPEAASYLIVPTDLVRLTAAELRRFAARAAPDRMVIAPDRHGEGTNALLVPRALIGALRFGPGSFRAHCALAEAHGLEVVVDESPAFAWDLDDPADYEELMGHG